MAGKLNLFLQENKDTVPSKEPVLVVGTSAGTVAGVLALLTFIFPHLLTDQQINVILVVGAFLLPIISALFTRGKVWSPASVVEIVDEALEEAQDQLHRKIVSTKDIKVVEE